MYETKLTAAMIKEAAREFGADLVGIGSIERWKDVPAEENPVEMMPRAKSVICMGFRVHRGTLRGAEEGTAFAPYTLSGFEDVNRIIAPIMQRRLCSYIEDFGYEALPIMYFTKNLGIGAGTAALRPDGTEKPRPEVFFNFRTGGVLCGVGEIGHSRVLLTKEFGPAQRLYFVVTEAELEQDPIVTGICDNCMECVTQCPANALTYESDDDIDVPGITTIHRSSIDVLKCRIAHVGGGFSPFAPDEVRRYSQNVADGTSEITADGSPRPTAEELQENVFSKVSYAVSARTNYLAPAALCGNGCVRACLAHLEKKGVLTRKFHHSFRD